MNIKKADLREFVEKKTTEKIKEIEENKISKMEQLIVPVVDAIIAKDCNVNMTAPRIIAVIDGLEKVKEVHPVTNNSYKNSGYMMDAIRYLNSSLCRLDQYIKAEYLYMIKMRANIKEFNINSRYHSTSKEAYIKNYTFENEELEEKTQQLINYCKSKDLKIEQLNQLEKELLQVIKNASTPNKAYKNLKELGVDMTDLKAVEITSLVPLKLSVDVCLLNGDCDKKREVI